MPVLDWTAGPQLSRTRAPGFLERGIPHRNLV